MGELRKIRVGAVIKSADAVLLQCRTGDAVWAVPGGKVEPGERVRAALLRELGEEIGEPATFQIGRFAGCIDNSFDVDGCRVLEIGLYFFVDAQRLEVDRFFRSESTYDLEFKWWKLDDLAGIDLRPMPIERLIVGDGGYFEHDELGSVGRVATDQQPESSGRDVRRSSSRPP